jgi:hypothetical protein
VHVGESAKSVQQTLGRPELLSDQVWSYGPLLLLLDDERRKVAAIAVNEADAFACLLPAAFQLSCDDETGAIRSVTVVRPPTDEIRLHEEGDWPGTITRPTRACSGRRSAPPLNR